MVTYSKIKTLIRRGRQINLYQLMLAASLFLLFLSPFVYLFYIEVLKGLIEKIAFFLLIGAVFIGFMVRNDEYKK